MKFFSPLTDLVPLQDILGSQPLQAINQQFFGSGPCSVDDVVCLLEPYYDGKFPTEEESVKHEKFMKETLPDALETLTKRHESFLLDFVFFVSGSRCIPSFNGFPDFRFKIFFNNNVTNEHLPRTHTCENLLHVPWDVYGNKLDLLVRKLGQSTELGKFFDMN